MRSPTAWYNGAFHACSAQTTLQMAEMQTIANTETSALRVQQLATTRFQVKAEEEQSKDREGSHGTEIVSYFSLKHPKEKVLANFT